MHTCPSTVAAINAGGSLPVCGAECTTRFATSAALAYGSTNSTSTTTTPDATTTTASTTIVLATHLRTAWEVVTERSVETLIQLRGVGDVLVLLT